MTPEQLKASILQYAIQGKLVEQRAEEGTAEELYQQIQAEKQRLIAEKKIKKEKPLAKISEDEIPFDIPESWKWVRLGDIFQHNTGKALNSTKNKNAKARCFPHWKTVPEGSGLCDLRKIRGSRPWSIRREGQRQRLFLALLERLLVEFLELSSSAPLVYWLGCLCSLVALLVVWLDVRFEV